MFDSRRDNFVCAWHRYIESCFRVDRKRHLDANSEMCEALIDMASLQTVWWIFFVAHFQLDFPIHAQYYCVAALDRQIVIT